MKAQFLITIFIIGFSGIVKANPINEFHALVISAESSYLSSESDLSYAKMDAMRVSTALKSASRIPKRNIHELHNPTVAEILKTVRGLQKKTSRKFLFYFSGHSDEFGLHLRDGQITKQKFHELLASISSKIKIVVLDSCFSGSLKSKGVRSSQPLGTVRFDVDEPTGSVILTSSSGREMSYESEKLKGSIFTNHVVAGLYGRADGNEDGLVTIDELYQYVYGQTKYQKMVSGAVGQSPEFDSKLSGQGAVVVSFPSRINGEILLAENLQGEFTFASTKGMNFFKFYKSRGDVQSVEVPQGKYNVTLLESHRIGKSQIQVKSKKEVPIKESDLIWKKRKKDRLTAKGKKSEFLFGVNILSHGGYQENQSRGSVAELRILSPGTEAANGLWRLSLHLGGSSHKTEDPSIEKYEYQRFTLGGEGTYGKWKAINNVWIFGARFGTLIERSQGQGAKTYL